MQLKYLFTGLCLLLVILCGHALAAPVADQMSPDTLAVQGRWVRTDAPYVIELRHAEAGQMQATYYNPKPIHVAKTEIAEQDGLLYVLIELQDVNYPGSTYVISYDRTQDTLQGLYFVPASQQSFEVTFVRQVAQ